MYCLELGGEDDAFAAYEARAAATAIEVVAPGLATARGVNRAAVERLAYTHAAGELLARTNASVSSAVAALEAAGIDREGTVAVRARDVRSSAKISASEAERALGSVLVERGFAVDLENPDHELRALFSAPAADESEESRRSEESEESRENGGGDGVCLLGWLTAESLRDYGDRRPTDRPFFQPGSMAPLDARAFVNIAGAEPGTTLLDPMCGTGGVLLEAGLVGAHPVGVDAQRKMVRGARENLRRYVDDGFAVVRGDATDLPLRTGSVDAVVFDAPYGRQSKIARHELSDLVAGALAEARRVGVPGARCVLVADRSWTDAAEAAGWTVDRLFERRVHRSLTRYVHALE